MNRVTAARSFCPASIGRAMRVSQPADRPQLSAVDPNPSRRSHPLSASWVSRPRRAMPGP